MTPLSLNTETLHGEKEKTRSASLLNEDAKTTKLKTVTSAESCVRPLRAGPTLPPPQITPPNISLETLERRVNMPQNRFDQLAIIINNKINNNKSPRGSCHGWCMKCPSQVHASKGRPAAVVPLWNMVQASKKVGPAGGWVTGDVPCPGPFLDHFLSPGCCEVRSTTVPQQKTTVREPDKLRLEPLHCEPKRTCTPF